MSTDRARFADLARIAGPTDERPPYSFACAARVGFSDTDAQGIVYYGRYAPYFDMARVEYLRYLGLETGRLAQDREGEFVMRHFEIDYHAPATYDDQLEIFVHIPKVGTSSVTYEYAVYRVGEDVSEDLLLANARQVMVHVDLRARRPLRIPDGLRTLVGHPPLAD